MYQRVQFKATYTDQESNPGQLLWMAAMLTSDNQIWHSSTRVLTRILCNSGNVIATESAPTVTFKPKTDARAVLPNEWRV